MEISVVELIIMNNLSKLDKIREDEEESEHAVK